MKDQVEQFNQIHALRRTLTAGRRPGQGKIGDYVFEFSVGRGERGGPRYSVPPKKGVGPPPEEGDIPWDYEEDEDVWEDEEDGGDGGGGGDEGADDADGEGAATGKASKEAAAPPPAAAVAAAEMTPASAAPAPAPAPADAAAASEASGNTKIRALRANYFEQKLAQPGEATAQTDGDER